MNRRILCLMLVSILAFAGSAEVLATSISEIEAEQEETKDRLNEINKSISEIEEKQKDIRAQLSNLDEEMVETMLTLEILEGDIEAKKKEIEAAQAEYERLIQLEDEQYNAMKLRIQYLYEKGSTGYIEMLLDSKSVSDFLNKADFAAEVYEYDNQKLTEYQGIKEKVEETKARLEDEQTELLEVQEDQKIYKQSLDTQIANAKSRVSNFESELASAKEKVKEYQQTIQEQNERLRELEAEGNDDEEDTEQGKTDSGDKESSNNSYQSSGSGMGVKIANYALKFVGNPYVFGGNSLTNGIDCSGFTQAVHAYFGISIPRQSTAQSHGGKKISLSAVQPGDIIYYGNHVGIYIGGHKIVHASNERDGIKISSYTYRTPIRVCRYW